MPDDFDHLIDSLADLVRRHRTLTVRLARETGLAASHMAVLATLGRLGEVRLHTLAEELFVDPSVISRHVSALEQEACIDRRPDPADARAALIRLSPSGEEALARVRQLRRRHLQSAMADWPETDVASLATTLQAVAPLLDHHEVGE